jgi:hypothetical protein
MPVGWSDMQRQEVFYKHQLRTKQRRTRITGSGMACSFKVVKCISYIQKRLHGASEKGGYNNSKAAMTHLLGIKLPTPTN